MVDRPNGYYVSCASILATRPSPTPSSSVLCTTYDAIPYSEISAASCSRRLVHTVRLRQKKKSHGRLIASSSILLGDPVTGVARKARFVLCLHHGQAVTVGTSTCLNRTRGSAPVPRAGLRRPNQNFPLRGSESGQPHRCGSDARLRERGI
jgi:hypothetical protein